MGRRPDSRRRRPGRLRRPRPWRRRRSCSSQKERVKGLLLRAHDDAVSWWERKCEVWAEGADRVGSDRAAGRAETANQRVRSTRTRSFVCRHPCRCFPYLISCTAAWLSACTGRLRLRASGAAFGWTAAAWLPPQWPPTPRHARAATLSLSFHSCASVTLHASLSFSCPPFRLQRLSVRVAALPFVRFEPLPLAPATAAPRCDVHSTQRWSSPGQHCAVALWSVFVCAVCVCREEHSGEERRT